MTRDQAYGIIADAMQCKTETDRAWAGRIATALDALGLLNWAADPNAPDVSDRVGQERANREATIAAARAVTGDLLGEAHITEADLPGPDDPAAVAAGRPYDYSNALADVALGPGSWAGTRDRT